MKKLLICKNKVTYRIINGEQNIDKMTEVGEQVFKNESICIKQLTKDSLSLQGLSHLVEVVTNKDEVFNYIDRIASQTKDTSMMIDVAIEENIIRKIFDDKRETSEHFFTVVYNIVDTVSGKSIANEFSVFDILNEYAYKNIIEKIQIELYWNKLNKIKCLDLPKKWIFSSAASGFFFHECIGHLLEEEQFHISEFKKGDKLFNASINIFENWEWENELDDLECTIETNILLLKNGKIENIMSACLNGGSGNAYTQEPFIEPMARMNGMYVNSINAKDNIFIDVVEGIFIKEISSGEYNPLNGEIGLSVSKAYKIENGKLTKVYFPLSILFNISDLLENQIVLDKKYETVMSLCGKYGAVKKIKYTVPEMKVDWSNNGKFITNRSF